MCRPLGQISLSAVKRLLTSLSTHIVIFQHFWSQCGHCSVKSAAITQCERYCPLSPSSLMRPVWVTITPEETGSFVRSRQHNAYYSCVLGSRMKGKMWSNGLCMEDWLGLALWRMYFLFCIGFLQMPGASCGGPLGGEGGLAGSV